MIELKKRFTYALTWNILESVIYQGALMAHTIALFSITDRITYGTIGTIFSLIYFFVMITNFGLDISLAPFFNQLTLNKRNFRSIAQRQLFPEVIISLFIIFFVLIFYYCGGNVYTLSAPFLVIITLLMLGESIKKSLRMILQLAQASSKTACIEVITVLLYISFIWIMWLCGVPISIELIFIPMFINSLINCGVLSFYVYRFYQQLPNDHYDLQPGTHRIIFRNRLFNFLNQATHLLISGNFLVPYFAFCVGLSQAGVLKLISSLAQSITIIMQRTFGISSSVILTNIQNVDHQTRQTTFTYIYTATNQVIYGIIIFLLINFSTLIRLNALHIDQSSWLIAYLFLIISFSENFFLCYERFYICHAQSDRLFIFNSIMITLLLIALMFMRYVSPLLVLLTIIALRIGAFIVMSILSFKNWRIRPSLQLQPLPIACAVVISVAFYLFFQ